MEIYSNMPFKPLGNIKYSLDFNGRISPRSP